MNRADQFFNKGFFMEAKKIFIACDHAGYSEKIKLIQKYPNTQWIDLGCYNTDRVDYPDYASKVADELLKNPNAFGVLICGSGQGMAMRANKYSHIRAALCWNKESVQLAREHNDANVLCLGARLVSTEMIHTIFESFVNTSFAAGRHADRVNKIGQKP